MKTITQVKRSITTSFRSENRTEITSWIQSIRQDILIYNLRATGLLST